MALTQQSSKWARSAPTIRVGVLGLFAAFLLVLPLALAPRAEAYIYWTQPSVNGGIGRANLNGTGVNKGFINPGPGVADIAVNDTHIYWTYEGADMIGRANIDGTGVDPNFFRAPGALFCYPRPGGCAPVSLAVDSDHIYWTTLRGNPPTGGTIGGIGRAKLDGTGVDADFISGISPDRRPRVSSLSTATTSTGPTSTARSAAPSSTARAWSRDSSTWRGATRCTSSRSTAPTSTGSATWATSRNAIGRADLDGSRVTNKLITGFNPFGGSDATGLALDALGPPPSNEFGVRGVKVNKKGSASSRSRWRVQASSSSRRPGA